MEPVEILGFLGRGLVDVDGEPLGPIDRFYLDQEQMPQWVSVVVDGNEKVIPLDRAALLGGDLQVGVTRELVLGAPLADFTSPAWTNALIDHFGSGVPLQGGPKPWP